MPVKLEPEEEARLLQAASQIGHTGHHQGHWSPIYIVSQLGLNTGLRKSEVTRLRWCELDLQRKLITRIALSKSDAGIGRFIPLNQPACAALKLWAARFPNHKAEHYVFPACENGKIDPRRPVMNWRTAWKKVCAVAGMPGLRFHDLRHTAATKLLENGVPYPVVAQILGWSPTTAVRMAKRYGHIRPEIQRRALDGIATQPLGAPAIVHQIDNRIGTLLKSSSPQVVESISVGA